MKNIDILIYVEVALREVGLSDQADNVLGVLYRLLDEYTPEEIRRVRDDGEGE